MPAKKGGQDIKIQESLKGAPTMKLLIVYYSLYGHIYKMAEAAAEGARTVEGTEVILRRVPETLSAV